MNAPFLAVAACLLPLGCSLSVGAGAQANLGHRDQAEVGFCRDFESCDAAYRAAARRAERCRKSSVTCEAEERDVSLSYRLLREQTQRELDELRRQAWLAQRDAQAARADEAACANRIRALGEQRAHACGGWFEEPTPIPATPTRP